MKISTPMRPKTRIDMIPMMDMIFLLLVFFIYAMLSMAVHRALPVDLPTSTVAPIHPQVSLSITISPGGAVFLDQEPVALEHLAEALKERTGSAKDPGVQLFADNQITYQTLYQVIDQIKLAGIDRLSLESKSHETR